MKRAFSILAMAALLGGCASYNDDDDYGSSRGTVGTESGGMHSSEQFPGQEPLPQEQRVPDDEERDINGELDRDREIDVDVERDGVDVDVDDDIE